MHSHFIHCELLIEGDAVPAHLVEMKGLNWVLFLKLLLLLLFYELLCCRKFFPFLFIYLFFYVCMLVLMYCFYLISPYKRWICMLACYEKQNKTFFMCNFFFLIINNLLKRKTGTTLVHKMYRRETTTLNVSII